jgi:ABC-type uncharacterized transport system substrate-binding protein
MTRVSVVAFLALALVAAPLAAEAQATGKVYRIGILAGANPVSEIAGPDPSNRAIRAFLLRLRDLGYIYGQNLVTEARSTEGRAERLSALVVDLVRLNVDVIVVPIRDGARAVKATTTTIPIVMVGVADPVGLGLIASLARPGGNVTGVSRDTGPEIIGKRLELLKEAVPKASRVAVLTTKSHWGYSGRHNEVAARVLGMTVVYTEVDKPDQYAEAFAAITRERADALLAAEGALNFVHRRRIVDFAATSRLPAMYAFRESMEAGGLMAFGVETGDLYRRAAVYVDKILKGAKPADLPVEQPIQFELVINLKTVQALGLTIPPTLLFQATEVIR